MSENCIHCQRPTAFNSGFGLFVNRIPADDGWACAECSGFECDECHEQIYLDCEVRVDYEDSGGNWHYGNYHEDCHSTPKHGPRMEY